MVVDLKKIFKLFTSLLMIAVIIVCVSVVWKTVEKLIYPQKYSNYVEEYSEKFNVDKMLVYAIIKTESSFNSDAVSEVGAVGLMQIMPETFDWLQTKLPPKQKLGSDALFDPETNIRYGVFFLSLLQEEFDDTELTIAAYHAGRGRVNEWLDDSSISPDGVSIGEFPSRTTAHYVDKVTKNIEKYKKIYSER